MSEEAVDAVVVEAIEIDRDRNYWLARPWLAPATALELRDADVLVVPWEGFRPGRDALFPEGTSDLVNYLRRGLVIAVAIDKDNYSEIALYSSSWRLPTLFCQYAVIPLLINLLSNEIDRRFISNQEATLVSAELIIEGPSGRCVSIKYKGPPKALPAELLKQAESCFPKPSDPPKISTAKTNAPLTLKGQTKEIRPSKSRGKK